jgi:hypothetical protein
MECSRHGRFTKVSMMLANRQKPLLAGTGKAAYSGYSFIYSRNLNHSG